MKSVKTVLLIALLGSVSAAADEPIRLGSLLPGLVFEHAGHGFTRLDAPLARALASDDPLAAAARSGFRVRDGLIQVEVVAETSLVEALVNRLRSNGAREVAAVDEIIEAYLGPEQILTLDREPGVTWVRQPVYGVLPEPRVEPAVEGLKLAVISEGVAATNVEEWHGDGFTGNGVKVGVIDIESYGWENLVGTELPSGGKMHFREFGGSPSGPGDVHGTAVAEIVHDMAPDAEIYLARIGGSSTNFNSAVQWMIDSGVRVMAMSISYFGTSPKDGTGFLQSRIDSFTAVADGVWAHSAGNRRQSHWRGVSEDADGNGWVEVAPGSEISRLAFSSSSGDSIRISLHWNDWDAVNQDYSLHLFRIEDPDPVEVASADRSQTGLAGQTPTERLNFTVQQDGRYGVGIFRKNVTETHDMEFFSLDEDLSAGVEEGSITIPGDAAGAMSAAALSASSFQLRSFSSAGPTNGPGGTFEGGAIKPEIAGYDGVSTASYGGQVFGTSFACPHVAGAAAVVMSANPEWSGAQVRSFLESTAIDRKPVGKDNDTGWGRLSLGPSPLSSCTYALDQTTIDVSQIAGPVIINVDTADDCFWAAETNVEWMKLSADAGTGSGRVGVLIENNDGPSRIGTLTIAGHTVTVNQEGSDCVYSVFTDTTLFEASGGDGEIRVTTTTDCAWTAESQASWIQISGGSSGTGSGEVLFDVATYAGATQRVGTIDVAGQSVEVVQMGTGPRYMVAGIAETGGAAGTRWKSDLAITNRSGGTVSVTMTYRHDGGSAHSATNLMDGELVEYRNVVADLFGSADSAGVVDIQADGPLTVTARTFNDAATGTFGQFLPGVEAEAGIDGSQEGVLSQLSSNDDFRANIGFVNFGTDGVIVGIRLYDGDGTSLGSELGEVLGPGQWTQVNRVFREANAGDCVGCYARIQLDGEGPIWAYASVVDNGSGDPTTIPMEVVEPTKSGTDLLVAGIAETGGAGGTRWKSNLAALNLSGGEARATLEYRFDGGVNTLAFSLADGELVEWENVAAQLGAPDTSGAAAIDSDVPLVVTARTFNDAPEGTFGQFLPGLGAGATFGQGGQGVLSQIRRTDDFRTNIGFTNYGDTTCTTRLKLFGSDGVPKGNDVVVTEIPAGGWKQQNRVFQAAGVAECPVGYAVVSVDTPGCRVWAYASVVDNGSGDPTTIPVGVE